jgi:hypothetical protein
MNLSTYLPHELTVQLLDIYPLKTKAYFQTKTCMQIFSVVFKIFLLVYNSYTGCRCDISVYVDNVCWFGSSPPLFPSSPLPFLK